MTRKTFFYIAFFCAPMAFLACNKGAGLLAKIANEKRPGDAHGTSGIARFDNARLRCGFLDQAQDRYRVLCQVALIDASGNERLATSVAPDVTLQWKAPKTLEGDVQDINCRKELLSQSCDVRLASAGTAKLEFALQIETPTEQKTEMDTVLLPYSVSTIGFVPQIPVTYSKIPVSQGEKTTYAGFQSNEMDPAQSTLQDFGRSCAIGDAVYFSAANFIYVLEKGRVKIFAGSGNAENLNEYSHRLRIYLRRGMFGMKILCSEDGVYALDGTRVVRLSQEGPVRVIIDAPSVKDRFAGVKFSAMALANDKSVYVYDESNVVFFKIVSSGAISTVFEQIKQIAPALDPLNSFAIGKDGSLYFVNRAGHIIYKLDPQGGQRIFAGLPDSQSGFSGDGGPAASAQLLFPSDIAVARDGSVFIADAHNKRVRKVDGAGTISTVATFQSESAQFSVSVTSEGLLMTGPDLIQSLDTLGNIKTIMEKNGGSSVVQGQSVKNFSFPQLYYLATAPDGSLYAQDYVMDRLLKVDPQGMVTVFAGEGATQSHLREVQPDCFTLAPDGTLYIADGRLGNHKILVVEGASGKIVRVIDLGSLWVKRLAVSPKGVLYLVGGEAMRVQRFDPENVIAIGPPIPPPKGFAVAADGSVIFSDGDERRIKKMDSNGIVSVIAGGGDETARNADLPATGVSIDPGELSIGENGKIYFVDSNRIDVLKPQPDGSYTLSRFIGSSPNKDCGTGIIRGKTSADRVEDSLRASLGLICQGTVRTLSVKEECSSPLGEVSLYYAQCFTQRNCHIVKAVWPCHP